MEVTLSGTYRNEVYANVKVKALGEPRQGNKGWFINVDGAGYKGVPQGVFRMSIRDPQVVQGLIIQQNYAMDKEPVSNETDEQIVERIAKRFAILAKMAAGAASGAVRSMIVSGGPGVGKSFTVEKELEVASDNGTVRFDAVKGTITPINLYKKLYELSDKNCVLMLDDCDSILFEEQALNLLKSALDTNGKRRISWMSEHASLKDIPESFVFQGAVIFITNLDFQRIVDEGKNKLVPHFEALLTRSLYLDLTLRSKRELVNWIGYVVREEEMLVKQGLTVKQSEEVLVYLKENLDRLRTVSLREALKAANLVRANPKSWRELADVVMLKTR